MLLALNFSEMMYNDSNDGPHPLLLYSGCNITLLDLKKYNANVVGIERQ